VRTVIVLVAVVLIVAAIWAAGGTPENDRPDPFGGCQQAGQRC